MPPICTAVQEHLPQCRFPLRQREDSMKKCVQADETCSLSQHHALWGQGTNSEAGSVEHPPYKVYISNIPPHIIHPKPKVNSKIWVTKRVLLQEGLCLCITTLQSLKYVQDTRSPRLKHKTSLKVLLKGCTYGGQHAAAELAALNQ